MRRRLLLVGDHDNLRPSSQEERDEERMKLVVRLGLIHADELERPFWKEECPDHGQIRQRGEGGKEQESLCGEALLREVP